MGAVRKRSTVARLDSDGCAIDVAGLLCAEACRTYIRQTFSFFDAKYRQQECQKVDCGKKRD